jgi:hypothetical protein
MSPSIWLRFSAYERRGSTCEMSCIADLRIDSYLKKRESLWKM